MAIPSPSGSEPSDQIIARDIGDLIVTALENMRISDDEPKSQADRASAMDSMNGQSPYSMSSSTGSVPTPPDQPAHVAPGKSAPKPSGYPPWHFGPAPRTQRTEIPQNRAPFPGGDTYGNASSDMDVENFTAIPLTAEDFAIGYDNILDSLTDILGGIPQQGMQPDMSQPYSAHFVSNPEIMDPALLRYLRGEAGDPSGSWTGPTSTTAPTPASLA